MQRMKDLIRELRIAALSEQTKAHMAAGRTDEGRVTWLRMAEEIKNRSPQQVARMERAMGLRQ